MTKSLNQKMKELKSWIFKSEEWNVVIKKFEKLKIVNFENGRHKLYFSLNIILIIKVK